MDCLERDEKLAFAFAVSTLARCKLPQCRTLHHSPLILLEPKKQ
jgi:hypothetical protein